MRSKVELLELENESLRCSLHVFARKVVSLSQENARLRDEVDSDPLRFAVTLLAHALEHHERHYVNGRHDGGNCPLCHLLIDVSNATGVMIPDLKLIEFEAAARLLCAGHGAVVQ
ncbi:MAG TPA: hypothetical protein VF747_07975 [Blastocatellia bacterium]|jgi:hypothetical protein